MCIRDRYLNVDGRRSEAYDRRHRSFEPASVSYVCAGGPRPRGSTGSRPAAFCTSVWLDKRLSVGQEWWAEILNQIRLSEAIVVALPPGLLESPASAAERGYAVQMGKVLLPVCLRTVRNELLPPDLAPLQIVDYCTPGPGGCIRAGRRSGSPAGLTSTTG